MENPKEGRATLERSLAHAPNTKKLNSVKRSSRYCSSEEIEEEIMKAREGRPWEYSEEYEAQAYRISDYKSYSYRLIGRTYFCEENYPRAVLALRSAVQTNPSYYDAHYDLAQYCAQIRDVEGCLSSLKIAILQGGPVYFYLAGKEKNFASLREDTQNLLTRFQEGALGRMKDALSEAKDNIDRAYKALSRVDELLQRYGKQFKTEPSSEHSRSRQLYEKALSTFEQAKQGFNSRNYATLLEAESDARHSCGLASEAKELADNAQVSYGLEHKGRLEESKRDIPKSIGYGFLIGLFIDTFLLVIFGLVKLFTFGETNLFTVPAFLVPPIAGAVIAFILAYWDFRNLLR